MRVKLQLLLALMLLKASVLLAQTGRSIPSTQFYYESAVYLKSLDKVFTVSSDDQGLNAAGNTLSIVSPIWARAEQSFQVGYNPRQLCASPDETQLYFLADGPALLKQFNVNTKTIVQETPLPAKQYFYSLRASPFSANRLIAFSVTNDSAFVYLIQQGVFRPQKLAFWNPERMQGMDFIDDNTVIAWSSSTIFWLKLNVDGLVIEKSFSNVSFAFDEKGFLANGKLITEKGRVFNLSQTEPFEEPRLPLSPYLINLAWAPNLDYFYALEPTDNALKLSFSRYKKSDLSLENQWVVDYAVYPFGLYSVDEKMVITGSERLFFRGETYTHIAWNCIPSIKAPIISPQGVIQQCNLDSLFLKTDRSDLPEVIWSNRKTGAILYAQENGLYSAKYSDPQGCQTAYSAPVNFSSIPSPYAAAITTSEFGSLAQEEYKVCLGGKLTLRGSSFDEVSKWIWSNGDTTQSIRAGLGVYSYRVRGQNGCLSEWRGPIKVVAGEDTLPPKPKINLLNAAPNFCMGDKILAETSPGYRYYFWSPIFNQTPRNEITAFPSSQEYTITVNVRVANSLACISDYSESLQLKVKPLPIKPSISLQGNQIVSNVQGIHQWYLNGQLLEGFTGNAIPLKSGGFYAAKSVVNNCASDFSNLVPVSGKTTAVKDIAAIQTLQIQPNPAQDFLKISLDGIPGKAAQLRLFSADGKEHERRSIEIGVKGGLELNVSQLSRGVYFMEIKTSEAHFLGKFIKL
jgi:Secretion system C-terminal sorting domain